ncbi:Thymidylate kinase [hydrothermal vent metagenome]|uniref:Thymidylate kinase n=1 Tax=hydrothermal vent metagenome TaxID=652676 RepID=A0A1W1BL79_9ZZZZ
MKIVIAIVALIASLYSEDIYTNALINETSPYLKQHAHNPVDWYPWGKIAFDKAKREDKLIFVSIGYSTCHWCHVMEKESFTDIKIAQLLNRDYISIKVDREQFPHIDKKYQQIFSSATNRSGGWPLSLFLTPDREPLYISTYIPRYEGYGSIGMEKLLPYLSDIYHNKRDKMVELIDRYKRADTDIYRDTNESIHFEKKLIEKTISQIERSYDKINGGFANRPKFPESSKISLLLDIYRVSGEKRAFDMAKYSLEKMARSGLYDQIDGGFFRYTTDAEWQIPHFEKMLYTNAELISLYSDMYLLEPNPLYLKVIKESISQIDRDLMRDGLYLSASDADSDGEEGGYYIYNYTELMDTLKKGDFNASELSATLHYLGIEEDGNIDGELSHSHITSSQAPKRVDEVILYLRELRKNRTFPFVDEKINTAWNAMMIKALFRASRIDKRYIPIAKKRLKNLLTTLSKDGTLYHQTIADKKPTQIGILEDYSFVIDALIEAHQVTLDEKYLQRANDFAKRAIKLFYRNDRWYLSSDDIETLADIYDSLYTSPLSMMLHNLSLLALLEDDIDFSQIVDKSLDRYGRVLNSAPSYAPKLMSTLLLHKIGGLVIKSSRKNLEKYSKKISKIRYPFVYRKTQKESDYLACKIGSCFAYSKDIDGLISELERR